MDHFKTRRNRASQTLPANGCDSFLVTNIHNVRYLTGFTGSAAFLLLAADREVLLSDGRYRTQIESECPGLEFSIRDVGETLLELVQQTVKSAGWQSMAIESARLTLQQWDTLQTLLPTVDIVKTYDTIEQLRAIKDDSEIAAIRRSIEINEAAFLSAVAKARPTDTERQFAFSLEHEMRVLGAIGFAFDPIVAVGPRAALPHGRPSDTPLGSSSYFLVDWGANVDGYLSDLTRVVLTDQPDDRFVEIYQTVLSAQAAAIDKISVAVNSGDIDQAARSVIQAAGYGDHFSHGTGHSFGLQIHERPLLTPQSDIPLRPGMVLTIEPGIYLPDFAGVRIEDDVLVTENGPKILSNLSKDINQHWVRIGEA